MATRIRIELNSNGVKTLLNSDEVGQYLYDLAAPVEQAARAGAPVGSAATGDTTPGSYRDSIFRERDTTDRAIAVVGTRDPVGRLIEARTGNLARALDAAGGAG